MSAAASIAGPDAHNSIFQHELKEHVPSSLSRATLRMEFPPSYVLVGVYRLFTDKNLYKPAWDKCKHATRRGLIVGAIWAALTFSIQRKFIELFLSNSPRVTGLSTETMFGYTIPFSITTYAALSLMGSQVTTILRFFLSRNIRIARDRAWDQTVASRGKGADFWQGYVEEWADPPRVAVQKDGKLKKMLGGWFGIFVLRNVLLTPFQIYPFVGTIVTAAIKAYGMGQVLHNRYFQAKKMNPQQVAVFMEEHKWEYRMFGFAASILEGLPIIGLAFTISNRIGAAMWAHDLEKRQHYVAQELREGRDVLVRRSDVNGTGAGSVKFE